MAGVWGLTQSTVGNFEGGYSLQIGTINDNQVYLLGCSEFQTLNALSYHDY
jgi:hypothetical protein